MLNYNTSIKTVLYGIAREAVTRKLARFRKMFGPYRIGAGRSQKLQA